MHNLERKKKNQIRIIVEIHRIGLKGRQALKFSRSGHDCKANTGVIVKQMSEGVKDLMLD